jgi:hypothetical protein
LKIQIDNYHFIEYLSIHIYKTSDVSKEFMKKSERRLPLDVEGGGFEPAEQSQPRAAPPIAALTEDAILPAPTPGSYERRARGRPATGKRSNPDWKLYSHFLQKKTQRAAVAKLQAEDDGRDLSDVLQRLLEDWLKS